MDFIPKKKEFDPKLVPEVNIGTVGHVDHGKSTLVQGITGKWPAAHSEELKRGITIKLGYADASIYKCKKCKKYYSSDKCPKCFEVAELQRTVSFVDAPGHETLMATVLAGASLMDGVILIIAANEKCPQPQTKEHLMVLDIVGIKNIIIAQTKIDLVSKEKAEENYKQIKEFVKGTVAEDAPIIPVSAQHNVNISELLSLIQEKIPTPKRDDEKAPKMLVVRSFDVNKPGTEIKKLNGGILGGSLVRGKLEVGDEVEIRPGINTKGKWEPIKTKITGLQKAGLNLKDAGPGGLLGVMTDLDPSLTKSDSLGGNLVGQELPKIHDKLNLKINLLDRAVDAYDIEPIKEGEQLMLNIGTTRTVGVVTSVKKQIEMKLKLPICAEKGDRVVISRLVSDRWRLIGWSKI